VKPFVANGGGYLTLSFIPTLGTMILGLAAGRWLKADAPRIPMKRFLIAGAIGIAPDSCCILPASARSSNASGRPVGRCSAAASVFLFRPVQLACRHACYRKVRSR